MMVTGTQGHFLRGAFAGVTGSGESWQGISRREELKVVSLMPGSITQISERLHRDRSAVKRDVDELERAGLVTISDKVLTGHGRMKEVRATANRFSLQAEVV